jgi:hypothetical protein
MSENGLFLLLNSVPLTRKSTNKVAQLTDGMRLISKWGILFIHVVKRLSKYTQKMGVTCWTHVDNNAVQRRYNEVELTSSNNYWKERAENRPEANFENE